MLKPHLTSRFKRDYRRLEKRGYDTRLLDEVVGLLLNATPLPQKHKDHPLKGDKHGYRDCHIEDDWVLVYKVDKSVLTLILAATGTHADVLE
ncbi:MAG: type II toxin-antitoxin system YafQ family toxin [Oscillospiraceae bacterium]|jgi:mRNA interferase YafQ|nr:type II toxin-antitoxin system YafQ family toxin [Oscillospiraceae bacterium]